MVRADEEALAYGERLLSLYPEQLKDEFRNATQIVSELKRRQQKGTFGKSPSEDLPEGYVAWDLKRKTAYLIDALDEVDARQFGQPGGVDLASDRRVQELIRLGDVAVPDLIDAVEKDERLTRSVHFWRDFASRSHGYGGARGRARGRHVDSENQRLHASLDGRQLHGSRRRFSSSDRETTARLLAGVWAYDI